MKQLQLIIALIILTSFSVTAQNKDTKNADKHFAKLEFVEAIAAYEKLVEKGTADAYVYGRLAEANYNIFNTTEAERYFAKTLKTNAEPELIFKYSEMLKANGKYEASNEQMQKFASMRPSDDRAMMFMANPNYLPKILDRGKKFNIQNLALNSAVSDFGGTFQEGKLYITTARNSARKTYGWNQQPFLDLYEFTLAEDSTYHNETLLGDQMNTKYHEGLMSFTPDGKTVYFSRESFFEDVYVKDYVSNTNYSVLHLYKASKSGGTFSKIEPLSINSRNYSIKNPSVSPDGSTLYFASDRPGGFGKFDIYKAPISPNGHLGTPVNMGQKVNTESQEMFPFISSNNTLYFSSIGHLGLGGMDVFYTKEIDGKLAPIRNVGIPVNSNGDDFAFRINEVTKDGFVSSNRDGGKGGDDIYAIKKIRPLCDVLIVATVVDTKTKKTVTGATTSLLDGEGNILSTKTTDSEGKAEYIIACEQGTALQVTMSEYENNTLTIPGSNEEEVAVVIALDPIEKIIEIEQVVLNPIYFDFDKSNITAKAAFELDNLVQAMTKYPNMVIYATSHTDIRGSNAYNNALSDRRAKTSVQYIISKGIDPKRISGAGKGENELTVNCANNCTEEQHQLNRRTEFRILSGGPHSNN
ncbi:OmpA family protein [Lacinutrix sp. Hel_I_90]|uniref:OmpA family protein n=1 Tax=Lacinutrix sp. Hel_I_90 TaxID=1249999 RepID=UPI0005C946A4|nr:OmpA family protein [Lacinutrix sp. Hel_I_90]